MNNTFTFHSDPSHGWLEVSDLDLKDVGAAPRDFSRYSYKKGSTMFYLEEDCDAPKFIALFKAKYGVKPTIDEHHHDGDFVEENDLTNIGY